MRVLRLWQIADSGAPAIVDATSASAVSCRGLALVAGAGTVMSRNAIKDSPRISEVQMRERLDVFVMEHLRGHKPENCLKHPVTLRSVGISPSEFLLEPDVLALNQFLNRDPGIPFDDRQEVDIDKGQPKLFVEPRPTFWRGRHFFGAKLSEFASKNFAACPAATGFPMGLTSAGPSFHALHWLWS